VADIFARHVHVEWHNSALLTPFGQMPLFIEFVKQGGLFDGMVADCPQHYTGAGRLMLTDEPRCGRVRIWPRYRSPESKTARRNLRTISRNAARPARQSSNSSPF
jgi:hypothetical protein